MRYPAVRLQLVLVLALGCGGTTAPAGTPAPVLAAFADSLLAHSPGATWERYQVPELAGYQREGLDSVTAYTATLQTTGLVVTVHGRVLLEVGDITELSYLASVRKSILSMLFGNYVRRGVVRLDRTLAELGIDDRQGLTAAEKRATIHDLITARSGVYHPASNSGDNLGDAPPRGSQAPGSYFLYSNWDFNALGTIFEQETGRDIYDALESDLARPIGMQDFDRAAQRKSGDTTRSIHRAYHIWLSTRDMARVGQLMLRHGNWNGAQLVPADWVEESTRTVTPSAAMNPPGARQGGMGYGYLWWTIEAPAGSPLEGAYSGRGAVGQYITVIPRLDLVIAHKRAVRPGRQNPPVSWREYMGIVDRVIAARCQGPCQ